MRVIFFKIYRDAIDINHEIKHLVIRDLHFEPILHYRYSREYRLELEEDMVQYLILLREGENRLVVISPICRVGALTALSIFYIIYNIHLAKKIHVKAKEITNQNRALIKDFFS